MDNTREDYIIWIKVMEEHMDRLDLSKRIAHFTDERNRDGLIAAYIELYHSHQTAQEQDWARKSLFTYTDPTYVNPLSLRSQPFPSH